MNNTELKYPVLMIHGMGFRDYKRINYWGRIGKTLSDNGAKVYYGKQDSNGSVESNSRQIEEELNRILRETGCEKVNIIAHSKGGLEARYLISTMGYGDKIASLTTISTPHNGSVTVDRLVNPIRPVIKGVCVLVNLWFRILGDKNPDTYEAIEALTTGNAEKFNRNNPDCESVFYQSYAFVMKKPTDDIFMILPWLVVNAFEGENDGLLSPKATRWTNFRGTMLGSRNRGISHLDEVDFRRRRFSKTRSGDISDITEFYAQITEDLKKMGF